MSLQSRSWYVFIKDHFLDISNSEIYLLLLGGLTCDRCEQGFWGLHKISEGNSGCIRMYFALIKL